MDAPLLRFERVSKRYPARHGRAGPAALEALDLDVARGELMVLLGPSGSGKTTTLMLLAGFETPDSGRILLAGRDIAGLPAHRRGLGVVFQSYALFPHLTVAENLAFPLEARGLPRPAREAAVARALAMVRLEALADRRPAQLSGGQQQRVALARALVFEPAVVLLDEPLGALDKALREEMQHELRALHARLGLTMLHVTHDQSEALALADRIAVLAEGRLRQVAPPQEIYDRPADAFVAGFLGENNRLPGTVLEVAGGMARIRLGCGAAVAARCAVALAPGEPCLLMVRPEQVAPAADGIPARLAELRFQGDHLRLRCLLADGTALILRRPREAGGLPAELRLAWPASAAWAFRPEPAPG